MKAKPVPSAWLHRDGRRLDCGPYMSGALEARIKLERLRTVPLQRLTRGGLGGIFHAGRIKRLWANDAQHGRPFLSSTEILQADLSNLSLISHKSVVDNPKLLIAQRWTLITRSGTVGRMAYARPDMDGLACSEDVMRVVPDPNKVSPGYLYAYLSSKFGVPLIVGGTYGAIIQHIEPEHIADLPVPRLGPVEDKIGRLVEVAGESRSLARRLHREAAARFRQQFRLSELVATPTSVHRAVFDVRASVLSRMDAGYHSPSCRSAAEELAGCSRVAERLDAVARVFTPGIFKRIHVDDEGYGYRYYSGTELFHSDVTPRGFLSRRAPKIEGYLVKRDWLLIQDAGQLQGLIGRVVRVSPTVDGGVVSNHLVRVAAEATRDSAYINVVLASPHGYRAITRQAFGSSIPQLDPRDIGGIKIPWPSAQVRETIAEPMLQAWSLEDAATVGMREAVALVESAIEMEAS
jgi:type I restriction enzyme S subunit